MTKRHTKQNHKQNHKQKNGQFFTKNANDLLDQYAHLVIGKDVIDPFAGDCDLLDFSISHGAKSTVAYDLEPTKENIIRQDTLLNPPQFSGKFLLTNPPYLCSNKKQG